MLDLFISPRNSLLQNWVSLSSEAACYASLAAVKLAGDDACLFWLHADANSEQWLEDTIVQIQARYAHARIVVLANVPMQADALSALRLGATGYCHAYTDSAVLSEVKAVVSHGGIWLGQELLQHLIGVSREVVTVKPASVSAALALLTPREREVARLAAIALSNKEIARRLDITERTVKAHLSSSFERLGVKDRLQLALVLNETSTQAHDVDGQQQGEADATNDAAAIYKLAS